ncbi:unnamed protein product [Gongylonema pulchrum]|uniref:Uncharacterized protein n=1 Tax=Gongylonema pulchrum TaxID=637853 RepID=A0A3P6PI39_9BILA|nr:unnamed protein product [Gongylonema pulchrum]
MCTSSSAADCPPPELSTLLGMLVWNLIFVEVAPYSLKPQKNCNGTEVGPRAWNLRAKREVRLKPEEQQRNSPALNGIGGPWPSIQQPPWSAGGNFQQFQPWNFGGSGQQPQWNAGSNNQQPPWAGGDNNQQQPWYGISGNQPFGDPQRPWYISTNQPQWGWNQGPSWSGQNQNPWNTGYNSWNPWNNGEPNYGWGSVSPPHSCTCGFPGPYDSFSTYNNGPYGPPSPNNPNNQPNVVSQTPKPDKDKNEKKSGRKKKRKNH